MANHADAVLAWKKTLTPKQQDTWNTPNSVFNHCPLFAKERPVTSADSHNRPTPAKPKTEEELRVQASLKPSPEQIAKVAAKQTAEAEAEARALEAKKESEIRATGLSSEVEELKAQLTQAKKIAYGDNPQRKSPLP